MAVKFDINDFFKWREILQNLDAQLPEFYQNLDYLKKARLSDPALERERRELLGQALATDTRLKQVQRGLETVRGFLQQFEPKPQEQLAGFPVVIPGLIVSLGIVAYISNTIAKINLSADDLRRAELEYAENIGPVSETVAPTKTRQNLEAFALVAGVVLGGLFLLRRAS